MLKLVDFKILFLKNAIKILKLIFLCCYHFIFIIKIKSTQKHNQIVKISNKISNNKLSRTKIFKKKKNNDTKYDSF